ncbi:conserved hypothetical protein [delta proteobacterium NaphS2]|nr:conserved hypothetical protein [delta proteobacterium NaphS2]
MQTNKSPSSELTPDCFFQDPKTLTFDGAIRKTRHIDVDTWNDLVDIASGILDVLRDFSNEQSMPRITGLNEELVEILKVSKGGL